MNETKQSLSELWSLLRNKEEQFGLKKLSLTERDIFQTIIHFQGEERHISLEDILKKCPHPRATFFRCLKNFVLTKLLKLPKTLKMQEDRLLKYIQNLQISDIQI